MSIEIAIVGGGPGGLLTARSLEKALGQQCSISIFEAEPRVGGKIMTGRFELAPDLYEAGLAELYDYSHLGPDPLKALVAELGLKTVPMGGETVILGDAIVRNEDELERLFGPKTKNAADEFFNACRTMYSPSQYYERCWLDENSHPWANRTFASVLDEVGDETARRYIEASVRSDLATESDKTSALNALQNYLTGEPEYLRLYSIAGGIERLVDGIKAGLSARIYTSARVTAIGKSKTGRSEVTVRQGGTTRTEFI